MKKTIRKELLAARDALPAGERNAKSREIAERLFTVPEFAACRCVMFFASFRSEVETPAMIRRALTSGKRVVLPKVKGRDLGLFEILDYDHDVLPGAWGIPEPRETGLVALADVDLIVVPGAGFDEQGNRIGYGAGFYDKLLPDFHGTTIALAFELQVVPSVPSDPHDVPIAKIVTERRIIEAGSKGSR